MNKIAQKKEAIFLNSLNQYLTINADPFDI